MTGANPSPAAADGGASRITERAGEDSITTNLSLGRLGVRGTLWDALDLAVEFGFDSIDPDYRQLVALPSIERDRLVVAMSAHCIGFGTGAVPIDLDGTDDTFEAALPDVVEYSALMAHLGVASHMVWVPAWSDRGTYLETFRTMTRRVHECAAVLHDRGMLFGLEYLSQKRLWTRGRHPFIHTMSELRELIAAVGMPNVGVHLDSVHWFTAEETVEDIQLLSPTAISGVDLSDATSGIPLADLDPHLRELPGATGVFPIVEFIEALRRIRYRGPVQAEPFYPPLAAMMPRDAVRATADALTAVLTRNGSVGRPTAADA